MEISETPHYIAISRSKVPFSNSGMIALRESNVA